MKDMNEDWVECNLGDLLKLKNGFAFKSSMYSPEGIPVLRIGDIQDWNVNVENANRIKEDIDYDFHIVNKGDILIAMSGATTGKFGIYNSDEKAYQNQRVGNLIPHSNKFTNKKYIYFLLYSLKYEIEKGAYGGAQPNISASKIEALTTKLFPLPIQRAIVRKIEELVSSLDSGIADLKKAQEQLVIYRQAVLKKAFEGGLTKEWREKQTDLPSAEELLEQIKEERQNHYERQIEQWKKAVKLWEKNGKIEKKPSSISKPKTFPEVKLSDIEDYEAIPSSWYWTRFGTITYKIGDIDHKMPKTLDEGFPYVSTGNIGKDGKIDFDNAKLISKVDFERLALKIKPEKGDIIFPRYGTIGRNILIDYDKEFLVSYSCAIVKNITKIMDEKFVLYYSLSSIIKREVKRYVVETTQANIGISSIESFVYPLCSKEEQTKIVQEIESRLSVCDKVEESIANSLEKAKALRQSILIKAFEGKLLSTAEIARCKQDKDYEPAGVLLERIKKEKNKK